MFGQDPGDCFCEANGGFQTSNLAANSALLASHTSGCFCALNQALSLFHRCSRTNSRLCRILLVLCCLSIQIFVLFLFLLLYSGLLFFLLSSVFLRTGRREHASSVHLAHIRMAESVLLCHASHRFFCSFSLCFCGLRQNVIRKTIHSLLCVVVCTTFEQAVGEQREIVSFDFVGECLNERS